MTVNPARHGPFPGRLAPETIAAYAAATCDDTASVLASRTVPAVFPVILVFSAVETARAGIPADAWNRVRGGVHGEHDIVLHRPVAPGEALDTWAQISAMRTTRAGTRVAVHLEQIDADGHLAVEQWWTMVLLGLDAMPEFGSMPAEHRFPETARANALGSVTAHLDDRMAHRYADVSGDWSAHHFDVDVARAAGFDFVFAHGLCTMAVCTHRLLRLLDVDDPGRVSRVAVRFASPTPLGCDLTVSAYGIDDRSYAFEAAVDGTATITHGRLELRT
ncbi:MAG TPA: MaoC/PaaZ C-terminal domain-containing protein [Mycobacterium sp.]|jgi:acyl dehydratase|nr:MaoC/PaaZ C-terminal domain-containing protein [Mycobacterium sp.]